MVERAAETKGETVKTNLSTMKKHNKSDWKRLVASVRLNFEDDPQCVWDLPSTSLEAHEAGRGEYYSETASTTMIDTEVRVALLTKRQFKAHMVYQEMYGRDEAESMWRLACSSTDVYKETAEDGSVSIAVRLPKVWTSCARMEKSRRVVDIAEISQTMERAKKLFATPDCSSEISNEMGLSLLQHGRHFITPDPDEKEKASKTTPGADDRLGFKRLGLGSLSGSPSATPPNKRQKTWEEMTIAGGAGGSDEGDEEGNVGTVNLVLARTTTINSAKQTLVHRVDKKTCAYQCVRELVVVKLGRDHTEVKLLRLPEKLDEFEKLVVTVKDTIERAKNWTQGSVKQEVDNLNAGVHRLDSLSDEFASDLIALKKVRRVEVSEKGQENRKLGAQMRSIMGKGALPLQGFPKPMCSWVGTEVLKLTMAKKEVDLTVVGVKLDMDLGGYDATFSKMMVFLSDSAHPLAKAAQELFEMFAPVVAKMTPKLFDHLTANENVYHNLCKLAVPSEHSAKILELGWLQKHFTAECAYPEPATPCMKLGFAKPWLLAQKPWAVRWGSAAMPLLGLAAMLRVVKGHVVLLAWPLQAVAASGAAIKDSATFFGAMSLGDLAKWAAASMKYSVLGAGSTAFVPFGMQAVLVNLTEDSQVFWQPWLATKLWRQQEKTAKDLVRNAVTSFLELEGDASIFAKGGKQVLDFLAA